jgi:hypothetical protein
MKKITPTSPTAKFSIEFPPASPGHLSARWCDRLVQNPLTVTGTWLSVVVPLPNWP